MPAATVAKLTSKNQLTLPKRIVAALDWPTHFSVQVARDPTSDEDVLILWPRRLVSIAEQAETLGVPVEELRLARRLLAEKVQAAATAARPEKPEVKKA
jgi:hypothetical protein